MNETKTADLFVIGGGVNGCGIARDAAGRGLSVILAEKDDLASGTSSAATKLFHGGLRYLEYFELRLVRESLEEREALLRAMPHISWPMRFVLPFHKDMRFDMNTPASRVLNMLMPWTRGRRPSWLIRMGLFLYDHLGGRKILPATTRIDLTNDPLGVPLKSKFRKAYEYSDCWVQDARLVVLNARDAEARGARILTRTKVMSAHVVDGLWHIETEDTRTGKTQKHQARMLINAAGAWVADVIENKLSSTATDKVRLVRGSHIVTRKLYDHDKCYFFQGTDGRIIFAIPYEEDFTLIGTTDQDHADPDLPPVCTEEERDYLLQFASQYFEKPITPSDVVWTYSGVRPLHDDGAASASATTRDYTLKLDASAGAPALHVFGGKLTTYRRLAESAMKQVATVFPTIPGGWTAGVALPGGDFEVGDVPVKIAEIQRSYSFLTPEWARRLFRHYGEETSVILGDAKEAADLGEDFGATLSEAEIRWLVENEFAQTAEDIVWRRTKLGLRLNAVQIARIDDWVKTAIARR